MTDIVQKKIPASEISPIIDTPSAAVVTLVKPLVEGEGEGEAAPLRPKIGRAPGTVFTPKSDRLPPQTMNHDNENRPGEEAHSHGIGVADHAHKPGDFKFTMLLIALFIGVNLGLVALLHNNHHTKVAAAPGQAAPAVQADSVPPTAPEGEKQTQLPALMAPNAPLPAAPAVTSSPAALSNVTPAPSLPAVPPSIPPAPAEASDLRDLPSPSPSPSTATPSVIRASALPPAVAASVKTAPAPTDTRAATQALIAIIGKE